MIMLLVRSGFQIAAGIKGTAGAIGEQALGAASRYTTFGVLSSVIAGGVLLLMMLMTGMSIVGVFLVGLLIYLLLAWPTTLRRFFTERNFASLLAGNDAPIRRRAADLGLTALGWLLLAQAVLGLAITLPSALLGIDTSQQVALLAGSGTMGEHAFAGPARSDWWSIGVGALQLWAAIELIGMSDRHRVVASVYGAAAALVTLYVYWPIADALFDGERLAGLDPAQILPIAWIAIALVTPIGTLLLVNRRHAPEARARMRS
jgi:hypothetical protein